MTAEMVRFGRDEFVDVPPGDTPAYATKVIRGTNAFLAFIWLVNREVPKFFDDVHLVVDGEHTREVYADEQGICAEVVMGNGSQEQRQEEGFRIITYEPTMISVWRRVSRWINARSYLGVIGEDGLVVRENGIPVRRYPERQTYAETIAE